MKLNKTIFLLLSLIVGGCDSWNYLDAEKLSYLGSKVGGPAVAVAAGDSVITNQDATLYDRPNGTAVGEVPSGTVGLVLNSKSGWANVNFINDQTGVVQDSDLNEWLSDPGPPPALGDFQDIVIIGCSNTDNWLLHGASDPDLNLNPTGGQSGKTIVSYGEKLEKKKVWDKFKNDIGPETDLALYMICQRYGPGLMAARQQDVPFSLPAGQSGSAIYSEKDLVKNILGEMRHALDNAGLNTVPVAVVAMHFYQPDGANTNPCERIGSNGILAQWSYVDEINAAGAQSSVLRPSKTFTPLVLQENGQPWRMPAVSQDGDVNATDHCHLQASYVQGNLMPSFKTMLSGL